MEKVFNFEEEVFVILFKHCPPLLEIQAREMAKDIVSKMNTPKIVNAERIERKK